MATATHIRVFFGVNSSTTGMDGWTVLCVGKTLIRPCEHSPGLAIRNGPYGILSLSLCIFIFLPPIVMQ